GNHDWGGNKAVPSSVGGSSISKDIEAPLLLNLTTWNGEGQVDITISIKIPGGNVSRYTDYFGRKRAGEDDRVRFHDCGTDTVVHVGDFETKAIGCARDTDQV